MTKLKSSNLSLVAASKVLIAYFTMMRQAAFVLLLMVFVSSAWAQDQGATKLGVIDMRGVIQNSNALAAIREALDEQNKTFQEEVSNEELRLRQAERELNSLQGELTQEEFNERLEAFEARVVAIQRSIQVQKSRFDLSIQQLQTQLEQELLKIVSQIAQERQLSMVFQRQNVVIYNNALDITEEALSRLNERTKNITITASPEN